MSNSTSEKDIYTSSEIPNEETVEAFEEVNAMKSDFSIGKAYRDVDEMMEDLLTWKRLPQRKKKY